MQQVQRSLHSEGRLRSRGVDELICVGFVLFCFAYVSRACMCVCVCVCVY